MLRDRWLTWLLAFLLAPAGIVLGHIGAYALAYRDDHAHTGAHVHGYFETFAVLTALLAVGAVVGFVLRERQGHPQRLAISRLGLIQLGGFAMLELIERVLARVEISTLFDGSVIWTGLAAQLLVAGLLTAVLRWLVPLLAAVVPCAPTMMHPPSVWLRQWPSADRGSSTWTLSPRIPRGPPVLTPA